MLAAAALALTLVPVGTFDSPTWAGSPAGDEHRLYVTEKPGRLRVVVDGGVSAAPALDIGSIVESGSSERGLLSAAFAGGKTYVYFTAKAAAAVSGTAGEIQVREYPGDRLLLAVRHDDAANHNGGQLQIGPDGKLWLGTGDGGGSDDQFHHSQDPASLLGKLIRIDPASGDHDVLARGLRNPWRFSFDESTIVIADVGQNQREEVNVGLADNYGWPCREGAQAYLRDPGCEGVAIADPVFDRPHTGGVCSITGGYVVRDPGLPSLLGRYLYGDFCAPALRSVDLAAPASDAPIGVSVSGLSSFGEDGCGRIYTVSLNGPVSRLQEGDATPCPAATPTPTPTATPTPTPTAEPTPTPTATPTPTPTPSRRRRPPRRRLQPQRPSRRRRPPRRRLQPQRPSRRRRRRRSPPSPTPRRPSPRAAARAPSRSASPACAASAAATGSRSPCAPMSPAAPRSAPPASRSRPPRSPPTRAASSRSAPRGLGAGAWTSASRPSTPTATSPISCDACACSRDQVRSRRRPPPIRWQRVTGGTT